MSKETREWLNNNTLIGFTSKRGKAWHYRADMQGDEPNHYPGPIPIADIERRLFHWPAVESVEIAVVYRDPADGTTRTKIDRDHKAIIRPDTADIFAYFKDGYQIHQYHEWLLENVAVLLDDGDLHIGSAGLLTRGARAWVQIEVPETCSTPEGVQFRPFLLSATSLDGSLSTIYARGAQLVVCDNTLSAALTKPDSSRVKIKHSRKSLGRITEVREALDIVHQTEDDFARQVAALCDTAVSNRQWNRFLDAFVPVKGTPRSQKTAERKRSELADLWSTDPRVAPWSGTAFGVVQAVNTYAHHIQTVRGATRAERNAERAVTGKIDALDRRTVKMLNEILDGVLVAA